MDGLTLKNSELLVNSGKTSSELKTAPFKRQVLGQSKELSFADTLKEAVSEVNQLQKVADVKMQELATGRAESIPDVLVAAEKAEIALKLMVQVRNKVIDAYQEIMRMQV